MRFVIENTTIPVPKVLDTYVQSEERGGVILMENVDGERLDKAWARYGPDEKQVVISQLRQYLNELGTLTGDYVRSVDHGPCKDQFSNKEDSFGPYQTVEAFYEGLASALLKHTDTSWSQMVARLITPMSSYESVFTHNDLAPRIFLVRDTKVVALLDWELPGYHPDSWEYIKCYIWDKQGVCLG
jgi:aminoglycoside phosphotransferase (APT) family kinase protein